MGRIVLVSVIFIVGQVLCGVDIELQENNDVEEFQIPLDVRNVCDDDVTNDDDDDDGVDGVGGGGKADVDDFGLTRFWTKTLSVRNGGKWGTWGKIEFCPCGTYAVGYDMKIEPMVHGDDTSLNAIKLLCADNEGRVKAEITSTQGRWGSWVGKMECHRKKEHLSAFDLQVEGYQWSGDDTAANYVKFQCRSHCGFVSYLVKPPGHGFWGTWGSWSASCPEGSGICGIQTRVEKHQGRGDDTALNDVKFYCCKLPKKNSTSA